MELISKISKGTKMDQIYISKERTGFEAGSYVVITSLNKEGKQQIKPFYYQVKGIEPFKVWIINKLFEKLENLEADNILITGSFLDKGANFEDIDIVLITDKSLNVNSIQKELASIVGVKNHLIVLNNSAFFLQNSMEDLLL